MKQRVLVGCLVAVFACTKSEPRSEHASGHKIVERPMSKLEELVLGLDGCALEGYQIAATCPGMEALTSWLQRTAPRDVEASYAVLGERLITNISPAIRLEAAEILHHAGKIDPIANAAAHESHAGVLAAYIRLIGGEAHAHPAVARMLLAAADHLDVNVRLQAIFAISASGGMPGGAAKLVALAETDSEPAVRQAACSYGGKLGDPVLLPLYEKTTANVEDPAMYAACMEGLVAMFHNHPLFDTANEAAYRMFLARIAVTPRSETVPPWNVMSTFCYFSRESDPDKLAAWKLRATWFEPADVKKVMSAVVTDERASWMARAAAVESLVGLGATKHELAALKKTTTDHGHGDRRVLDKLASVLASE